MPCKTRFGVTSLAATALLWTLSTSLALAQIAFDVPSQPLSQALKALATQADLDIYFDPPTVQGLQAPALKANLSVAQALNELLSGTHLHAIRVDEHTIRVVTEQEFLELRRSSRKIATKGSAQSATTTYRSDSVAAATPTPGPSANTATDGSDTAEAAYTPKELGQVVVTAEKREERLQNVPISISVIGGQDLDRSSFTSVTDVLNTVPGVVATVSPQGGGTQVTVRGVSAPYALFSGSSPIAYYVDSVPFGLVRSAVAPDEDVYDLQRIEVLRGPQGTLYGADALNGVVRVLTNDPNLSEFDFKARSLVSTTDAGGENYGGDMAVNIPIDPGRLAARVVAGDQHLSGWLNSPIATHANAGDSNNVRLKVSALATDNLEVGLSAWHSQTTLNAPANADESGKIEAIHPQPISTSNNAYALKVSYEHSKFSVSSVSSYFVYTNQAVIDLDPLGVPATIPQVLTSRAASEELNLTSKLDGPWRWSAGAFYRDAKDSTLQYLILYPTLTNVLDDNFSDRSKAAAVYGEIGRRFFDDKLELSAGLRYFHDDSSTQANTPLPGQNISLLPIKAVSEATTPRAILTWHLTPDKMVYASYGQGFRSGFPQDELVPPTFAPVKPDKLTNYEIGSKGNLWDQRLSYDASAYYIHWKGVQQEIGIAGGNGTVTGVTVNGQSASGPGVDFSLSTELLPDLDFGVNFSWNGLEFDDPVYSAGALLFAKGARLGSSPEYTAGSSAKYSFPLGSSGVRGQLSASANYTSKMNSTVFGFGSFIGQSLLIARSDFTIEWPDHWRLKFFVDNLSNVHRTPLMVLPFWREQVRPRTIGAQIEYSYR